MIPEEFRDRIVRTEFREIGGQQTNGNPYTGVKLSIDDIGSVEVDYFRSRLKNYDVAMEMLEYLLLEAKLI
jgi:hypothetical protein